MNKKTLFLKSGHKSSYLVELKTKDHPHGNAIQRVICLFKTSGLDIAEITEGEDVKFSINPVAIHHIRAVAEIETDFTWYFDNLNQP